MGIRPRGDGEGRRHAAAPPFRIPRRLQGVRHGGHGLRPLLQEIRRLHRIQAGDQQGRPQGGARVRGRLVGAHDGGRGPRDRRDVEGLPVRGNPSVQPVLLCRAHLGHGRGHLAALPCPNVRVLRRLGTHDSARQPQNRSDEASPGGGSSSTRHTGRWPPTMPPR